MTSVKYIGMDVHKESISIAVRNSVGKVVMECVIETKASGTAARFLPSIAGKGEEADHGTPDPGEEDCRDHLAGLEEGGTFRCQLSETTSSLSASGGESAPSRGSISRR
jgi:hypothetical protein